MSAGRLLAWMPSGYRPAAGRRRGIEARPHVFKETSSPAAFEHALASRAQASWRFRGVAQPARPALPLARADQHDVAEIHGEAQPGRDGPGNQPRDDTRDRPQRARAEQLQALERAV